MNGSLSDLIVVMMCNGKYSKLINRMSSELGYIDNLLLREAFYQGRTRPRDVYRLNRFADFGAYRKHLQQIGRRHPARYIRADNESILRSYRRRYNNSYRFGRRFHSCWQGPIPQPPRRTHHGEALATIEENFRICLPHFRQRLAQRRALRESSTLPDDVTNIIIRYV